MKLLEKLFKGKQADKSINDSKEIEQPVIQAPIKEEISEERKNFFTGVWDSRRLLYELLKISQSVKGLRGIYLYKTASGQTPYKIRCKRVLSVINAFYGCKVINIDRDSIPLEILIPEGYPEMKMSELTSLIVDLLPQYKERMKIAFNQDSEYTSRIQLFSLLFKYRLETYKLSSYWDNVLETNRVGGMAIDITRKLYNDKIESINKTLDNLLLLLLGDNFDKTITEIELLEKYDYPNVTDEELQDKELDPWGERIKFEESDESITYEYESK